VTELKAFLDEQRLLLGPWQALERDYARLMLMHGFDDVRIVGGSGDHGGDVLGAKDRMLWIAQCKHTTAGPPPREALQEVVQAGQYYGANRMVVATSRPPGDAFKEELTRYERVGIRIQVADPNVLLRLAASCPEYSPSRRGLRDYQKEATHLLRESLLDTGRGQVVMATGLGKTIVMAETVADLLADGLVPYDRALVLAHTRELVNQLHQAFWHQLPKWVKTHQLSEGEVPSVWDGIVFATVQSAFSRQLTLPDIGLVLIDEAHHVGAPTFAAVLAQLRPTMLAGVTATPWRGDGKDLDDVLGPPRVRLGIAEGLRKGFLVEADYRLLADNLDWEYVQGLSAHNYSLNQLNRRLILPTRDEVAAKRIRRVWDDEKRHGGIVFSPSIIHAEAFAAMLRVYGFSAEPMTAKLFPRDRDRLLSRFRAGMVDILTTVDMFNEGVDVPDVDLIVFMRVTHSRRIFVQQLGRGLRLAPGKDKVVVLDFVTDLRRIAEVIHLDAAVRGGEIERLGLGRELMSFEDRTSGDFLREWMLDQADLFQREDDPAITFPRFDFPEPIPPRNIQ
jgi:superfamily II DNA or RNA helicase